MGSWLVSLSLDDELIFFKEIEIRNSSLSIKQLIKEAIDDYILQLRSQSI